jgi:hypothetical protein
MLENGIVMVEAICTNVVKVDLMIVGAVVVKLWGVEIRK